MLDEKYQCHELASKYAPQPTIDMSQDPEDLIPTNAVQQGGNGDEEEEEDEEDQMDWISLSKGLKDYEPDNTLIQSNQLQSSINIMYDIMSQPLTVMSKSAIKVNYDEQVQKGVVYKPKGSFMNTVGLVNSSNHLMLTRIEMLYLVSRGTIQPVQYFQIQKDAQEESKENEQEQEHEQEQEKEREIPLDILNLYTKFESEREIERYWIYAYLKRLGFTVVDYTHQTKPKSKQEQEQKQETIVSVLFTALKESFLSRYQQLVEKFQPLTSYDLIFQSIKLKINKISKFSSIPAQEYFDLNVWKPSTKYNKKSPPLADYRIRIFDYEDKLKVEDIYVPIQKEQEEQEKDDGKYIMAIVQHGITNYVELRQVDLSKGPNFKH